MDRTLWGRVADCLEERLGRAPLFHELQDAIEHLADRGRGVARDRDEVLWGPWFDELLASEHGVLH